MAVQIKRTSMSLLDYDKPTDEEVALVIDYWAKVTAYVRSEARTERPDPDISQELLARVATHQQWQKAMLCTHSEIVMDMNGIRCGECDRPCEYLSDVQIAEMSK